MYNSYEARISDELSNVLKDSVILEDLGFICEWVILSCTVLYFYEMFLYFRL